MILKNDRGKKQQFHLVFVFFDPIICWQFVLRKQMKTKKKEERNVAKEMLLITEMSWRPLKCPTMILNTDINGNTFIEVISSSHSNRSL